MEVIFEGGRLIFRDENRFTLPLCLSGEEIWGEADFFFSSEIMGFPCGPWKNAEGKIGLNGVVAG